MNNNIHSDIYSSIIINKHILNKYYINKKYDIIKIKNNNINYKLFNNIILIYYDENNIYFATNKLFNIIKLLLFENIKNITIYSTDNILEFILCDSLLINNNLKNNKLICKHKIFKNITFFLYEEIYNKIF